MATAKATTILCDGSNKEEYALRVSVRNACINETNK